MKKLLILVLIALLTTLSFLVIFKGVNLGSIEILGIKDIQENNSILDETIQRAGKLAEKDFTLVQKEVKENTKRLKRNK